MGGSEKPVVLCGKINGSNATESVQSDHTVQVCMDTRSQSLPAIGQWPHPRRSAAVQPTSQQVAAENDFFDIPQVQ